MRTISGLFDSRDQADAAVDALGDAGIASGDISLVRPGADADDDNDAVEGAGVGAAVGGALGALAAFAIPGIGPVVGAGWLAAALTGAAAGGVAGGLIGALADAGIDEADAHVYAEGVRRGGTLVTARVDESQADAAAAILSASGSSDLRSRRDQYSKTGWSRFDEAGPPWSTANRTTGSARML